MPLYEHLNEPRKSYAAVVSTVDDKIGQILDKLEELQIRNNSIVIFMSDNGHSTEDTAIRIDDHLSGLPKGTNYCANGGGGYTGDWRVENLPLVSRPFTISFHFPSRTAH